MSAFQFHIFASNKIMKNLTDSQTAAIINYSQHYFNQSFYSTQFVPSSKFSVIESYLWPEKFNSWFKQQKLKVEVQIRDQSFVHLQSNFLLAVESGSSNSIENLSELVKTLTEYTVEDLHAESKKMEVFDCFGKIVAALILNPQQKMPSELVQVPLLAGSSAGVFYWQWLIYLRPELRCSLLQELSLTWLYFLNSQGFLYSLKGLTYESDLLHGTQAAFPSNSKNLKKVLDVIQFIQQQVYSAGKDLEIFRHVVYMLSITFENKPMFNVFSNEYGVEACLRLIEIVIDLDSFAEDSGFCKVFAGMVEFMIFVFRGTHAWVKASSFTQEKTIKFLFEKVLKGLHEAKFEETEIMVNCPSFLDSPSQDPTEKSQIFFKQCKKQVRVSVNKGKVDLLIVYLYSAYKKFVAWNLTLRGKLKSW